MDFGSLIGAGASALGGIIGGGKKEESTTTETSLTPELEAQVKAIFERIPEIFGRPYPQYQGERVAGPTQSRQQMDPFISTMSANLMQQMQQPNQYQQRMNQVLDMAPMQISAPDLLGRSGASGVKLAGGYDTSPVTTLTRPNVPSWMGGQA